MNWKSLVPSSLPPLPMWHLTPTVDEVPVNPMLDYFENINIVKIIMGVSELSRFRLAYSRDHCPLARLSLTN